jgi:hypothetical protein
MDAKDAKGGTRVYVACKIPNGITITGYREHTERELVQGGGVRDIKMWRPTGHACTIDGPAAPFGQQPKARVVAGFAITEGVPKEIWDSWFEHNAEQIYVQRGLIFASEKLDAVEGHARAHKTVTTGFEGIDPAKPGARLGTQRLRKFDKKEAA